MQCLSRAKFSFSICLRITQLLHSVGNVYMIYEQRTTKSISFLLEKDCAHGLVNKDSRKEEINSISTIYQRYLSILRIFFKEKRQTNSKDLKHLSSYLIFQSRSMRSLRTCFLASLSTPCKLSRRTFSFLKNLPLLKRWRRRFVRAALYRNFFTG